jgi:hypothetical protein
MLPGKAIRRSAKWVGTAAAALITAAWIASAWRHVDYIAPSGHYSAIGIGRIALGWVDPMTGTGTPAEWCRSESAIEWLRGGIRPGTTSSRRSDRAVVSMGAWAGDRSSEGPRSGRPFSG